MVEYDPTLSILTAFLVISTSAVAFATFLVWKATKKMVAATKETMKLTIMPRVSIISHSILNSYENSIEYEFSLKNDGVADSFDVQVQVFLKTRSPTFTIGDIPVKAASRFVLKNEDKGETIIKYKISCSDTADNRYVKEFSYDIQKGVSHGIYGSILSGS
jgi:hypothetical protein